MLCNHLLRTTRTVHLVQPVVAGSVHSSEFEMARLCQPQLPEAAVSAETRIYSSTCGSID